MKKLKAFIIFVLILTGTAYAGEKNFRISVTKDKISPGKQVRLSLSLSDIGEEEIPFPKAPFVEGLDIRYIKSFRGTGAVGGDHVRSITFVYKVVALKEGSYDIGPISYKHGGYTYRSNSVVLTVKKERFSHAGEGLSSDAGEFDISKHIFLKLDIPKSGLYVNEKVPIKVKLISDWLDLENITLWEASSEYLIIEKFGERKVNIIKQGGIRYVVLAYSASIFAMTSGEFTIEPIKVKFEITQARVQEGKGKINLLNDNKELYENFIGIGDSRSLMLETSPGKITVLSLPMQGKPGDFTGGVGDFKFDAKVSPRKISVGEIVTLRMKISGSGNFDAIQVSDLVKWKKALKMYDPKTVKEEDAIFIEQSIMVRSAEIKEIPKITFSFFDPKKKKYVSASKGPFSLRVKGEIKKTDPLKTKTPGTRMKKIRKDIVDLKGSPGRIVGGYSTSFYKSKALLMFEIFPLIAVIAGMLIYRRIKILEDNPHYAAFLAASKRAKADITRSQRFLRRGNAGEFYESVFRIMQDYLGKRLMRYTSSITGRIVDVLTSRNIEPEILNKIKEIFSDCHLTRYTTVSSDRTDMKDTLEKVKHVIKTLNMRQVL